MRPLFVGLFLLIALALPALWQPAAAAAPRCRALDGDTVRCGKERIRLREVYAAERGSPGAERERRALQRRLDFGEVRVRRHGKDQYGRTLGDVYVGGRKVTQSDIGPRAGKGADRAGTRKATQAKRAGTRSGAGGASRSGSQRR